MRNPTRPRPRDLLALLAAATVLAALLGCSDASYDNGARVWIDPGERGLSDRQLADAYGEGYVLDHKGNMIQIQVTRADAVGNPEMRSMLKPGLTGYFPRTMVLPWEEGRKRYEQRQLVYQGLTNAAAPGTTVQQIQGLIEQARDLGMTDVAGALRIIAAYHSHSGAFIIPPEIPEVAKIWDRIVAILDEDEEAVNVAQSALAGLQPEQSSAQSRLFGPDFRSRWRIREQAVGRVYSQYLPQSARGAFAAVVLQDLYDQVQPAYRPPTTVDTVIPYLDALDSIEARYTTFVYKGLNPQASDPDIRAAVVRERMQKHQQLAATARAAALEGIHIEDMNSDEALDSALAKLKPELASVEEALGTPVLAANDEKNLRAQLHRELAAKEKARKAKEAELARKKAKEDRDRRLIAEAMQTVSKLVAAVRAHDKEKALGLTLHGGAAWSRIRNAAANHWPPKGRLLSVDGIEMPQIRRIYSYSKLDKPDLDGRERLLALRTDKGKVIQFVYMHGTWHVQNLWF